MENIILCSSALKLSVWENFIEGNLGIQILCGGRNLDKTLAGITMTQQHDEAERDKEVLDKGSTADCHLFH